MITMQIRAEKTEGLQTTNSSLERMTSLATKATSTLMETTTRIMENKEGKVSSNDSPK